MTALRARFRRVRTPLAAAATALAGLTALASPGAAVPGPLTATEPALSATASHAVWGTNGRVTDIVTRGSSAWISGGFDYVGPTTGGGVVVDPSSGVRTSADTQIVDDTVYASAPDGAGGYYLGGSFARVGSESRRGLAHIGADGSLDRAFHPKVTGDVLALAFTGGRLLVGGSFTAIDDASVPPLVALTPAGAVDPSFAAAPNQTVSALTLAGSSVYAGGAFTSIGGGSRTRVARLDAATGRLDTGFTAGANAGVTAVAVIPGTSRATDRVALGGDFTAVTGAAGKSATRAHLAVLTGTGSVTRVAPSIDGEVRTVAYDPAVGTLYAGGAFADVNGTARVGLAAFAPSGALLPFDAALTGCQERHTLGNTGQYVPCTTEVDALAVAPGASGGSGGSGGSSGSSGTLYVGGVFTTASGALRHDAASYLLSGASSPALTGWTPMAGARVRSLVPVPVGSPNGPTGIVVGGDFTSVGGQYHRGLAKIDLTTGQAVAGFVADADNLPLDLELSADGTRLFAGGSFRSVDGVEQSKVASLDPMTGAVTAGFKPHVDKDVYSIAVRGSSLYVAGLLTSVDGQPRGHAARLSAADGSLDTTWRADTSGPGSGIQRGGVVLSMAVAPDGSRVFLAGPFDTVNGSSVVGGIIAVDGATGAVNPSRLGGIQRCGVRYWASRLYLSDDGKRLYGGDECPDYIYQWDAVGLASAHTDGLLWTTWCNGGMQGRLEVNGHFYYGDHGTACARTQQTQPRETRQRQAVYDADNGDLLSYAPFYDSPLGVWSYAAVPAGLLVGGDFTLAGDRDTVQQGLALFNGTP